MFHETAQLFCSMWKTEKTHLLHKGKYHCTADLLFVLFGFSCFAYAELVKNWAHPGLFLFIYIIFKHKFYRKTVGVSGIRIWIVRIEGEHADHLTTTTALFYLFD